MKSFMICTPHPILFGWSNKKKRERERLAGHVAQMGERRGIYRVWVGKPEGKRPLGRPRHSWEDNIKMDLQEVECGGMDWIELSEDRDRSQALVNAVMNIQVSWKGGNFLTSWKQVSFSRRTLLHGLSKYQPLGCGGVWFGRQVPTF